MDQQLLDHNKQLLEITAPASYSVTTSHQFLLTIPCGTQEDMVSAPVLWTGTPH